MRTISRFFGILCATLLFAASARAQFVTPINYRSEGPGVRLTESLVVHPGVAVEGRFDTNPLQNDQQKENSAYMRLIGHLDIATRSPQRLAQPQGGVALQKIQFRLSSAVAYREYLSSNDAITEQRAVEVDAGLSFKLSPSRFFSFELLDTFARTVSARNSVESIVATGVTDTTVDTLTRDNNRATAILTFIPGGGRLSFALAYSLGLDLFEDEGFSDAANKLFHQVSLKGKWRLLPKTAITLEVIQQFYNYFDGSTENIESKPLRVYAGLTGLITRRLSLIVKAGYGNGFYDVGTSFNSILAKIELSYSISPFARVMVGYERLFDDSPFANYRLPESAQAIF